MIGATLRPPPDRGSATHPAAARVNQRRAEDDRYVAEVRAAMDRLSARTTDSGEAEAALALVEHAAAVDVDAPVASVAPAARYLKVGVKRLAGWYLRYLGEQVADLGKATAELGVALIERTDRLEGTSAATIAELAALRARVEDLERR
ncbi:hypothetical protein K6U06_14430 [Acidiferrimicrobium sp. IK]|uniref:hypothetical protein n=1 Tax=Acidiferrimicrobium sp. IK TaxID=2871700 RepID=UPI0021CB836C|nr:hypothetical protein [Acidiferrimicrobium sp. IK]MCU4185562.1 hypothetical protein [Acidiferrimicrobium sp. IK]